MGGLWVVESKGPPLTAAHAPHLSGELVVADPSVSAPHTHKVVVRVHLSVGAPGWLGCRPPSMSADAMRAQPTDYAAQAALGRRLHEAA